MRFMNSYRIPEPCLCGDPECPRCFPGSWERERQHRIHEEEHENPELEVDDCPECQAANAEPDWDSINDAKQDLAFERRYGHALDDF